MIQLLEIIQDHFGVQNVKILEKNEGIFLCEKKASLNKTYQIFFIDTTDNWLYEDWAKYLEEIVVDKYFEAVGFLQWNFYYYIITTTDKLKENSQRKWEIEKDETYTRKALLTEEEFSEWVTSYKNISEISKEAISNDLYTNWVNYLRERKLFFVFNSEKYPNYKQPVEDFINGLPSEDIEENVYNYSMENSDQQLKKIKNLKLNDFRKYPRQPYFDLCSVNLLHGPNAVGKTSFLDALELIITGKLFFKKDDNYPYKIELLTDTKTTLKFPANASLYKKRDIEWYNSGSNRGNALNAHFNRFNSFSSDAAFQLKQDDSNNQNNLEEIIAEIALGREVNNLEERIFSISKIFLDKVNYFLKESEKLNINLREKNDTIGDLNKQMVSPLAYKLAVDESAKKNQWKSAIGVGEESIIKLDNEIQFITNILLNIQSKNLSDIQLLTMETLDKRLKVLEEKKLTISNLKKEILKHQQDIQTFLIEIEKNKSIIPVIEELELYFRHRYFKSLVGLERSIQAKSVEQRKSIEIKQFVDKIIEDPFLNSESIRTKSASHLELEILSKEELLSREYSEIQTKIKQLEDAIDELAIVISNIKSLGQTFLNENPEAEDCPLCNTHFTSTELAKAIQKTQDSFSNSIALTFLKEELELKSKGLEEIKNQADAIKKIKQLSFLIFGEKEIDKSIYEIINASIEKSNNLHSITNSLDELRLIQSEFIAEGLTEEKYFALVDSIDELLSLKLNSVFELDLEKQKLIDRQTILQSMYKSNEKKLFEKQSLYSELFTVETQNEEQLNKQINILQEISNGFKQIGVHINFFSNTTLVSILDRFNDFKSVFETYKKASNSLSQNALAKELTIKEIQKISKEIELLKPKQRQAQFAYDELNKLLTEQNKNDFLKEYIKKNKDELVSIFKIIHSPREFKDIDFSDGKIKLISNDGNVRTLNEISTGQRSALALSIFLSLNKKLSKGPNILLFDDPVTYVDDMNVLSFFDYLRELVIMSNRQVFFATANDDLAFLFRKKFEFLENEFKVIPLQREAEIIEN